MRTNIGLLSSDAIVCIHHKETMQQGYDLMKNIASRHLPVVDDTGSIVGMLSDRDIQRSMVKPEMDGWSPLPFVPSFSSDDLVQEFMSWPIQGIDHSSSIAEAAELLIEKKISCLIVTRDKKAVGIITSEDLLKLLVQEHQNSFQLVKENISGAIYRSPIGSIAHLLSGVGI